MPKQFNKTDVEPYLEAGSDDILPRDTAEFWEDFWRRKLWAFCDKKISDATLFCFSGESCCKITVLAVEWFRVRL